MLPRTVQVPGNQLRGLDQEGLMANDCLNTNDIVQALSCTIGTAFLDYVVFIAVSSESLRY